MKNHQTYGCWGVEGLKSISALSLVALMIMAGPAFGGEQTGGEKAETGFRFTKHLVKSHTVDVVKSPVSSTANLLAFLAGSGENLVQRASIRFISTPLLNRKEVPELSDHQGMDLDEWNQWLNDNLQLKETTGELDFLIGGEAFYGRLTSAIEQAESSIDMQTYIFDNDDVAIGIAKQLKKKSQSLDVRVMYDGMGTIMAQGVVPADLPENHDAPMSMHHFLKKGDSNIKVQRIHNMWLAGDHNKVTVVDNKKAFIGGMNIGREYRHDWHDMMMELRGPVVSMLSKHFNDGWNRSSNGDLNILRQAFSKSAETETGEGKAMHLLQTVPGRAEIANAKLEAIKRAKSYIYIENAYFADDRIVHALCKARKRGVDVRVIIPERGNHGIMQRSNLISINRLIYNGVKVYRYPGMSHIKASVFDGWACFGTANYDKMSLMMNREMNIGTSDPEIVNTLLEKLFIPDMEQSKEVTTRQDVRFTDYVVELLADEA